MLNLIKLTCFQATDFARKINLNKCFIAILFYFEINIFHFHQKLPGGYVPDICSIDKLNCCSGADVRLERAHGRQAERRQHHHTGRRRLASRDAHVGKLAPPCGPTRVPHATGPGPPLLPGRVAAPPAVAPQNGGGDAPTAQQKDEWFV